MLYRLLEIHHDDAYRDESRLVGMIFEAQADAEPSEQRRGFMHGGFVAEDGEVCYFLAARFEELP
jgi:hypothetical protein